MGPGPGVEVVAPDRGPDVVDHADLGVHVHRARLVVLDVEDLDAVPAGLVHHRHRLGLPDHGGTGPGVAVRARHDRDEVQVGRAAQGRGEDPRDVGGPQVLVLHVHEPPGPAQRLDERAGDAALAPGRVGQRRRPARVGAQDLDGARSGRRRVRGRRGEPGGALREAVDEVGDHVPGQADQRRRVDPALDEHLVEVPDDRAAQLEHGVVAGVAVVGVGRRARLRVAPVDDVVAGAEDEVDAADVGDVAGGVGVVPDHDELLVVAAQRADALVEQHLGAHRAQVRGETPVLGDVVAEHRQVRAPQQPAHPRPAACRVGERLADGGPVVAELLVAVAAPPEEQHLLAGAGGGQAGGEDPVVRAAVDPRAHVVALGPRAQAGRRVPALGLGEEPVVDAGPAPGLVEAQDLAQPRQQLLAVRGPDDRRAVGVGVHGGVLDLQEPAHRDGRDTPRVVAGEVGEQLRVVARVVAHQHPRRVGVRRGEPVERGALAVEARSEQPAREQRPPRRQERAAGVLVVAQGHAQRSRHLVGQRGQEVDVGGRVAVGEHTEHPLHPQQRAPVPRAVRDERPQPSPPAAQRRDAQHPVDVVDDTDRPRPPSRHASHRGREADRGQEPGRRGSRVRSVAAAPDPWRSGVRHPRRAARRGA